MRTKYEKPKIPGEGAYGKFHVCRKRETGKFEAMKEMIQQQSDVDLTNTAMREIAPLLLLASSNVVEVVEADHVVLRDEETETRIVFEYPDADLGKHIRQKYGKRQPVPLDAARPFAYQIFLEYSTVARAQ